MTLRICWHLSRKLLKFCCCVSSAEGSEFILTQRSHCCYGTYDAFHFHLHTQPFFPLPLVAMTMVRHHLVPCIVLFTSIIKSIYIMKLQLTHTHRVACWNTKKGRFTFLRSVYESSWLCNAFE